MIEGLLVMLMWGTGSFLQAISVKKVGAIKTMFISNLFSLLIPAAMLFFIKLNVTDYNLILLFFSGLFLVIGLYNFYKGVEIGELAIVAPISGTYSLITVLLSIFLLKEPMNPIRAIAIGIILAGIFFISTNFNKIKRNINGVKEAFIGMLFQGLSFFILGVVAKDVVFLGMRSIATDVMTVFIITGFVNAILFFLLGFFLKSVPTKKDFKKDIALNLSIAAAIFAVAWVIFNIGLGKAEMSLHVPISSLSPAVTVLLAVFFMKEKLLWNQKIGIIFTMLGVFFIGF